MSDSNNERSRKIDKSEISVSDFSVDVPGVTQLLNPGLANQRKTNPSTPPPLSREAQGEISIKIAAPPKENTRVLEVNSSTSKQHDSRSGLASMGIQYEFQFVESGGMLCFHQAIEHQAVEIPGWKLEFYKKMKLDMRALHITVSFQEFAAEKYPFQKEAFGMAPDEFVQCVRDPGNPKIMHVFVSKKSLLQKKSEIESTLSGSRKSESTDSGEEIKIELAS